MSACLPAFFQHWAFPHSPLPPSISFLRQPGRETDAQCDQLQHSTSGPPPRAQGTGLAIYTGTATLVGGAGRNSSYGWPRITKNGVLLLWNSHGEPYRSSRMTKQQRCKGNGCVFFPYCFFPAPPTNMAALLQELFQMNSKKPQQPSKRKKQMECNSPFHIQIYCLLEWGKQENRK